MITEIFYFSIAALFAINTLIITYLLIGIIVAISKTAKETTHDTMGFTNYITHWPKHVSIRDILNPKVKQPEGCTCCEEDYRYWTASFNHFCTMHSHHTRDDNLEDKCRG